MKRLTPILLATAGLALLAAPADADVFVEEYDTPETRGPFPYECPAGTHRAEGRCEPDEAPPRDCASGPDEGSDEWDAADEWREWFEAHCPGEADTGYDPGYPSEADVPDDEADSAPEQRLEPAGYGGPGDAPEGSEGISASPADGELPRTGIEGLLAALGALAVAAGTSLLVLTREVRR